MVSSCYTAHGLYFVSVFMVYILFVLIVSCCYSVDSLYLVTLLMASCCYSADVGSGSHRGGGASSGGLLHLLCLQEVLGQEEEAQEGESFEGRAEAEGQGRRWRGRGEGREAITHDTVRPALFSKC